MKAITYIYLCEGIWYSSTFSDNFLPLKNISSCFEDKKSLLNDCSYTERSIPDLKGILLYIHELIVLKLFLYMMHVIYKHIHKNK